MTTTAGTPYISGLSPSGRLLASVTHKPVVYGTPLVAWKPATAPTSYRCSGRGRSIRGSPAGSKPTFSTSTVLNLKPGHWYYRVRGLNSGALRVPFMRWSAAGAASRVAKPTFRLLASN